MNKKFLLLTFLIVLLPACKKKPRYAPAPNTTVDSQVMPEKAEYDEELGAFVVKDDDNKFSAAAAAQANQEDELTAASSEQTAGDTQSDSAQYGLKNIYFEFNKYKINDLRPDQRPVLESDVTIVKSLAGKGYKISIEGHACDSAGSTEYNMMLSEDRARAVADYFKSHGVHGDLYTVGHGSTQLIVPSGSTTEQQGPNRRVMIFAYAPDTAAYVPEMAAA